MFACSSPSKPLNPSKIDYIGNYRIDSIYPELQIDSFKIARLIDNNHNLLEVETAAMQITKPHPDDNNENGGKYKVIAYRRFQRTEHWIIEKTRNYKNFDFIPYKGIILLITDTLQRGRSALKLAEKSQIIYVASNYDSAFSRISSENIVNKYEKHSMYSDVIIDGKNYQYTIEISSVHRITTDKIINISSDTTTNSRLR